MKRNAVIVSSLAGLALAAFAPAFAGGREESGSFDATYVKRDVQPIAEGHILMLDEATGVNKGGGTIDGFAVSCREIADLDKGNGSNSGYCMFARGGDLQTVKIGGAVTTVMKDGHPNTTLTGKWVVVSATGVLAGSKGEGTYTGYFTAEDKFHVDWKGRLEGPATMASGQ